MADNQKTQVLRPSDTWVKTRLGRRCQQMVHQPHRDGKKQKLPFLLLGQAVLSQGVVCRNL